MTLEDLVRLRQARDAMDRDYAQPLDVPALARVALMSPGHFSRSFRAAYGETPLYLPEQQALIFADGMTAPDGELRVWRTPFHETRVLPALRAMLGLPFERVLVSHGEPVHTRADFEAALRRPPWGEVEGS